MANPSDKSESIENLLTANFGFDRREHISQNLCVPPPIGCGEPAGDFSDQSSQKEYSITGMCQNCQDDYFGADSE